MGAVQKIVIGCRNSKLSIAQTNEVIDALSKRFGNIDFQRVSIKTSGDASPDSPISSIGVGVFVKEIENALLQGEIDIAVHSLKDLQSEVPEGLQIASVPYREDPRDAVVSRNGDGLSELPQGSIVATGSARRRALVSAMRNDLILKPIRGNVTTRLAMLNEEGSVIDALILAAAGLKRLGLAARVSEYLSCMSFVAAPGQGALALQTRSDDTITTDICRAIEHDGTRMCVDAERAFLATIGGGCSAPIGAHARIDDDIITLAAIVSEPSGAKSVRERGTAPSSEGIELGKRIAEQMIEKGARDLLPQTIAATIA